MNPNNFKNYYGYRVYGRMAQAVGKNLRVFAGDDEHELSPVLYARCVGYDAPNVHKTVSVQDVGCSSPFEWGYMCGGAIELSKAIIADYCVGDDEDYSPEDALTHVDPRLITAFAKDVISYLPHDEWTMSSETVGIHLTSILEFLEK